MKHTKLRSEMGKITRINTELSYEKMDSNGTGYTRQKTVPMSRKFFIGRTGAA